MKPILFNTEMVAAILEGRKTVTRRIMKPQPREGVTALYQIPEGHLWAGYFESAECEAVYAPPFKPGDVLYVRETWQFVPCSDCTLVFGCTPWCRGKVVYEDHGTITEGCYVFREEVTDPSRVCWRPSIHMPKKAARIFLRVKRVSAQRLQDCGNMQAKDEGCTCGSQFARVWDETIKPSDQDRYGWAANPWVWVIEFERCEKPKEETV